MFVIQRIDQDGVFVAWPGRRSFYTWKLQDARTFTTRAAAERECCPENEVVVAVDDNMKVRP